MIYDETWRPIVSAVVGRPSRHHTDDCLGEGCCSEAGIRLPSASLAAVDIVADAEDKEVAGEMWAAVDSVDDVV